MSDQNLEHIITAILVAIPATVAAVSSLKNGIEQKRVKNELAEVNGKISSGASGKPVLKKNGTFSPDNLDQASNPDWYSAPKLY